MTEVRVSWSELDSYRDCPHKHQLAYLERWQQPTTSKPLLRGTAWHSLLEYWYVHRKLPNRFGGPVPRVNLDIIDTVLQRLQADPTLDGEDRALLKWMFEGYIECYGIDPTWKTVAVEQWYEAPLGEVDGVTFTLIMKIDLLAKIGGRLWLIDNKTGGNLPTKKQLDFDDQFGLYLWCLRQLGHKVEGGIYNAARTKRNVGAMSMEQRFSRTFLDRTNAELDEVARDALATARKAHEGALRGSETRVIRERTPDTEKCQWKCSFRDACLHGRKGRDEVDFLRSKGFKQTGNKVVIDLAAYRSKGK